MVFFSLESLTFLKHFSHLVFHLKALTCVNYSKSFNTRLIDLALICNFDRAMVLSLAATELQVGQCDLNRCFLEWVQVAQLADGRFNFGLGELSHFDLFIVTNLVTN